MDNSYIADQFALLSRLMDIHGENSFKSKSYAIAAYNIEQLPVQLAETPRDKIFTYKGIGDTIGKKIIEILDKGELPALKDLLLKTPPGILEMLTVKGLGPKKICAIWKEMEIESLGELLYACNENRLSLYKGFGEKTQKNIQEAIQFFLNNQGSYLYAETEIYAQALQAKLKTQFPDHPLEVTGEFRRQLEIINKLEWVTTIPATDLTTFFQNNEYQKISETTNYIGFKGPTGVKAGFHITNENLFITRLVETGCSDEFLQGLYERNLHAKTAHFRSEEDFFSSCNMPFVPPPLRESVTILHSTAIPDLIEPSDIRGIIHSHSNWSDGVNTIEEMAKACIAMNLEYLVISDHSKSAVYARGLTEDRIVQQHQYIDELNEKFAPFHIFKSIECDILADGSLDYSDNILSTFDLVITSIHSNFKMNEEKATSRIIRAVENPYTTILGHMTGRLLLSRNGYPVDKKKVIEACAANKVVIEHNAHPRRLDMDWRWIHYALELGVLISIDPDAHSIAAFDHIRYGVLSAQKGALTKEKNLSSCSLALFRQYLSEVKQFRSVTTSRLTFEV